MGGIPANISKTRTEAPTFSVYIYIYIILSCFVLASISYSIARPVVFLLYLRLFAWRFISAKKKLRWIRNVPVEMHIHKWSNFFFPWTCLLFKNFSISFYHLFPRYLYIYIYSRGTGTQLLDSRDWNIREVSIASEFGHAVHRIHKR